MVAKTGTSNDGNDDGYNDGQTITKQINCRNDTMATMTMEMTTMDT